MSIDARLAEFHAKIEEHLRLVDASAQVVLKGHLLIEESLSSIIGKFVFHDEFIQEARLQFSQKIEVARSMSLDEHDNEMWVLGKAINTLRNELAHSLKSEKRRIKTDNVIDLYLKALDDEEERERHRKESEEVLLLWAITLFMGFLASFESEVERFRLIVRTMDEVYNPHRHNKPPSTTD